MLHMDALGIWALGILTIFQSMQLIERLRQEQQIQKHALCFLHWEVWKVVMGLSGFVRSLQREK